MVENDSINVLITFGGVCNMFIAHVPAMLRRRREMFLLLSSVNV
jgi:hypothetical protein